MRVVSFKKLYYKMFKIKLILFVLAGLFYFTFLSSNVLRIVSLQYPPFQYLENGEVKGVAYEIVQEVFNRLDYEIKVDILPWTRALTYLREAQADAVFTIYKTKEREDFLDYANEVLINQRIAFYKHKDTNINFDGNFDNLKGNTIGTVFGVNYGTRFDSAVEKLSPSLLNSFDVYNNFQNLLLKRIDLLINNIDGADFVIKIMDAGDIIEMLPPVIETVPSYLAFSKHKDFTDLKNRFEAELVNIKKDGTYNRILRKHNLQTN